MNSILKALTELQIASAKADLYPMDALPFLEAARIHVEAAISEIEADIKSEAAR